ncbi:MAG: ArsC/Spx/MgsR family protein [Alphaproteobacteria bacterium]
MVRVYGGLACRATQRSLRWMGDRGVSHLFIDLSAGHLEKSVLRSWIDEFGWQALIDKRSAAWRHQPDNIKQALERESALAMLLHLPHMMKIPIIQAGPISMIGWNAPNKIRLLGQKRPGHQTGETYNHAAVTAA